MREMNALTTLTMLAMAATTGFPANAAVLARVRSTTITDKDVTVLAGGDLAREDKNFETLKRRLELHHSRRRQAVREAALNKAIDERLLALEAATIGTTPADLIDKLPVPQVQPDEIRAYYILNQERIVEPLSDSAQKVLAILNVQARERARSAYLRSLRDRYKVGIEFQPVREEIPTQGPDRGIADAPITIVEFADFDCDSCGRFEHALRDVLDRYRGKVRMVFRQLPLADMHPYSQKAAEAAICAQNQGKFWEMHDLMFLEQSRLSVAQLKEKAKRAGVDTAEFDACLDDGKAASTLAADIDAAEKLGIAETPASFVNGRYVEGALTAVALSDLIEDELARLPTSAGAGKR